MSDYQMYEQMMDDENEDIDDPVDEEDEDDGMILKATINFDKKETTSKRTIVEKNEDEIESDDDEEDDIELKNVDEEEEGEIEEEVEVEEEIDNNNSGKSSSSNRSNDFIEDGENIDDSDIESDIITVSILPKNENLFVKMMDLVFESTVIDDIEDDGEIDDDSDGDGRKVSYGEFKELEARSDRVTDIAIETKYGSQMLIDDDGNPYEDDGHCLEPEEFDEDYVDGNEDNTNEEEEDKEEEDDKEEEHKLDKISIPEEILDHKQSGDDDDEGDDVIESTNKTKKIKKKRKKKGNKKKKTKLQKVIKERIVKGNQVELVRRTEEGYNKKGNGSKSQKKTKPKYVIKDGKKVRINRGMSMPPSNYIKTSVTYGDIVVEPKGMHPFAFSYPSSICHENLGVELIDDENMKKFPVFFTVKGSHRYYLSPNIPLFKRFSAEKVLVKPLVRDQPYGNILSVEFDDDDDVDEKFEFSTITERDAIYIQSYYADELYNDLVHKVIFEGKGQNKITVSLPLDGNNLKMYMDWFKNMRKNRNYQRTIDTTNRKKIRKQKKESERKLKNREKQRQFLKNPVNILNKKTKTINVSFDEALDLNSPVQDNNAFNRIRKRSEYESEITDDETLDSERKEKRRIKKNKENVLLQITSLLRTLIE